MDKKSTSHTSHFLIFIIPSIWSNRQTLLSVVCYFLSGFQQKLLDNTGNKNPNFQSHIKTLSLYKTLSGVHLNFSRKISFYSIQKATLLFSIPLFFCHRHYTWQFKMHLRSLSLIYQQIYLCQPLRLAIEQEQTWWTLLKSRTASVSCSVNAHFHNTFPVLNNLNSTWTIRM